MGPVTCGTDGSSPLLEAGFCTPAPNEHVALGEEESCLKRAVPVISLDGGRGTQGPGHGT